jgi:hypothetical protein
MPEPMSGNDEAVTKTVFFQKSEQKVNKINIALLLPNT